MLNLLKSKLLVMLIFASPLFSQPGLPGNPPQGPIGSLALVLLALGGGILGYKKLKK